MIPLNPYFTDAELAAMTHEELLESIDPVDLLEDEIDEYTPQEMENEKAQILADVQVLRPLLLDLLGAGFRVKSPWFLNEDPTPQVGAGPILLEHLQRDYPLAVKRDIATWLQGIVPAGSWEFLRRHYEATDKTSDLASSFAFLLAEAAGKAHEPELIEILQDPRYGRSRIALVRRLWRMRSDAARTAVRNAVDDPDLSAEAQAVIKGRGHND